MQASEWTVTDTSKSIVIIYTKRSEPLRGMVGLGNQQCNAFPNHRVSIARTCPGSRRVFKGIKIAVQETSLSYIMITIYDTITFLQNTHNRHSDIKLWEVVCDLKVRTTSSFHQYCTFQNMMSYEKCYFVNPFPGLRVAHHASRIMMQLHKPEGRTGVLLRRQVSNIICMSPSAKMS